MVTVSILHVADVERGGKGGGRREPHAPGVLELVGVAGIEDEVPPRVRGLVNGSQRLDEKRQGQLREIISTMPWTIQAANFGPRAIFAASFCSRGFSAASGAGENAVWTLRGGHRPQLR